MSIRVRWSRVLLVILPLLAVVFSACGVLKPVFSHQGRLTDGSGNPVPDGNYEIVYSIYISDSLGFPESYSETQTVAVQDGLFTTSIGLSNAISPTLFAQQTWLGLTINGEELTPKQRMQGAPFAFSLVSGAAVMGDETRLRTFFGNDNTGAALTVYNRNSTSTGGHALLVANEAEAPNPDRDVTAALVAIARGGENDFPAGDNTGAYGAIIMSEEYRGLYAKGAEGDVPYYAAVFDSSAGIQILGGGTCTGCALAYVGFNVGPSAIEVGDFVTIEGVELDADLNIPVMQVRRATATDANVIGVATGAMTREPVGEVNGARTGGYQSAGGSSPTASNGYVTVVVQGLIRANVGQVSADQLGQQLQSAEAATPAIGRLMSAPESNGLAWVMLSGQ